MANRGVSVGVKINGDAKGFKSAAEDAKKATQKLKQEIDFKKQQKSMDNFVSSLKGLAATYITIQAAQKIFITGMQQTGENADRLDTLMLQVNKSFGKFTEILVSGDFTNGIEKLKAAATAARDLYNALDISNDRLEALDVYKAATDSKVKMLRVKEAEGTITKKEQEQLKFLLNEQLSIEKDIYDKRLEAYLNYIKKENSLDETLFQNFEQGIIDMATNTEANLDKLTKSTVESFKKFREEFIKNNTTLREYGGLGDTPKTYETIAPSESIIGAEMSKYISSKSLQEQAILIREILGTAEWKEILGILVKRNQLEGDYARNLKITSKELKKQKDLLEIPSIDLKIKEKFNESIKFDADTFSRIDLSELDKELSDIVKLPDYEDGINRLTGLFNNMFTAGVEGWESFGDAAKQTIKMITAEIMTRAAIWMLMNILTGGTATEGMKLGQYLLQGFGISTKSASAIGSGNTVLKGRDIYMSGNRYGETLIKNT